MMREIFLSPILSLLLVLGLSGCTSQKIASAVASPANDRITLLTYNVENLFDTDDDPERNDEAFLPAATKADVHYQNKCRAQNSEGFRVQECLHKNWSPEHVKRKLSRLSHVIRQVDGGRGPDVLMLQEIESPEILEQWRKDHLADLGYQTLVLVPGPDERGINPALLSRLPLMGTPVLHTIDFEKVQPQARPSRGILQARLRLPDGEPLNVFVVHFPSQGAPTAFRKHAIERLIEVTAQVSPQEATIVGGDFNVTAKEEYKEKYFKHILAKDFAVSHLVGCSTCVGTTYFSRDGTWSYFDVLLFNERLKPKNKSSTGWQLDTQTIQVMNSSIYQMRTDGTPARFGSGGGAVGVSDHWPMYAEIKRMKSEAQQ